MKKLSSAILFLFIAFSLKAQLYKFPQPGFWQGEFNEWGYCTPCKSGYDKNTISYLRDTIVSGYTFSILDAGSYGKIYTGYNNGTVFMVQKWGYLGSSVVLYDFSLKLNDLFTLYKTSTATLYGTYQVDSVSTIACLNGQIRKFMRLKPYSGNNAPGSLYWVDGIGDIKNGFLYQQTGWIDSWGSEHFVCSHDSSGMVYEVADTIYDCNSGKTIISTAMKYTSCTDTVSGSITAQGLNGCKNYLYSWSNGANTATINGLSPGTYTVTVTDCGGNTSSTTVKVGKPSVPKILASKIEPVACPNNCDGVINFSVSGGVPKYTFLWSMGGSIYSGLDTSISNLCEGTYTITTTDATGCSSTAAATISHPSKMVVTFTTSIDTSSHYYDGKVLLHVSGGKPYTYHGNNYYSFMWSNGCTGQLEQDSLGANLYGGLCDFTCGTYSVRVFDEGGWNCNTNDTISVSCLTGSKSLDSGSHFSIDPNPNNGLFTLHLDANQKEAVHLTIYNPLGQLIYSESNVQFTSQGKQIDLGKAPPGIYLVRLLTERGMINRKILIE